MHQAVWVITSKTQGEMEDALRTERTAEKFAAELEEESDRITAHFFEDDVKELEGDIAPPIEFDGKEIGGRWNNTIDPEAERNYATGRRAAERPNNQLPRAVISPEGRYIMVSSQEEIQEIRRVLLHWPDNVVVSEDWHR